MFLKLLLAFLAFSLSASIYAQIVTIDVTDYGTIVNPTLISFIDTQIQTAETTINKDLPSGTPDRLMQGMANSSVMAGKGIGTDYASNMSVFLIGGGVGIGADLEKPPGTDSPASGIGVAPGIIVGFNLGFMDSTTFLGMRTDKLNLYFNFMSYDLRKEMGDPGKETVLDISMLAFGTHLCYDWISGNGSKIFGWGGVKFTLGFESNKTKFDIKSTLSEEINETATTGEVISGTITGAPESSILATTTSIPLAISTDIQFLYFISLYTGLGVDYNMGQAKGKGELNGAPSTLSCTGGVACGAPTTITVRAAANLDSTVKVDPFTYRAFAGFQFNLPWTRVFVQVDKSLSNDLIGATAGVRFAF